MTTESRAAVRRLALARATSLTGGAAAFAALNFAIYQRTHSPGWVAASLLLTWGTGGIASIFAGSLGDRFDRKAVMVVSDLAGAAVFGVMAFVDDPGWLIAWAFLSALVESPFLAASAAAIPNLVDDEHIGWANGLVTLGTNAGIVLGPLAGGVLVATIGPGPVFALNAVSFVVSAALVWSVTGSFSGRRDDASEHAGVWAGIRFLTRERVLRAVALAWIPLAAGQGMTIVADVPLVGLFGAGGVGYGILISCWGRSWSWGSARGPRWSRNRGSSSDGLPTRSGAGWRRGSSRWPTCRWRSRSRSPAPWFAGSGLGEPTCWEASSGSSPWSRWSPPSRRGTLLTKGPPPRRPPVPPRCSSAIPPATPTPPPPPGSRPLA